MRKYVFDRVHHTFDVLHDVAVRPAEDNKALILTIALPNLIVGNLAFGGVRRAVDLNDDPLREAGKSTKKKRSIGTCLRNVDPTVFNCRS